MIREKSITFKCDYCGMLDIRKASHYKKQQKHFCTIKCYSKYREEILEFYEHNNYKGVRQIGESKQVYHRRYCKSRPEVISHLKARRYARERNAPGSHSLNEWIDLKIRFNNKCAICGSEKKLSKDHIIPLSKGGSDFIYNIQPLCKNCNSKKHNKILFESPSLTDKPKEA